MTNPNPATPGAQAPVTPGSGEQDGSPPSATPQAPATPAPGNSKEGTVTISTKEFAQLQRDAARTRSFGKRVYNKPSKQAANVDPDDPNAAAIAEANKAREEAERRAMQLEVRGNVRDLLADDRFKGIPQSTKDLILQSPHMLSEAETPEEAMYDIEDKLLDIAGKLNEQPEATPASPSQSGSSTETPPVVTPGSPAPVDSATMEDTSNLRGSDRSTAILRNSFRKKAAGGGQQV